MAQHGFLSFCTLALLAGVSHAFVQPSGLLATKTHLGLRASEFCAPRRSTRSAALSISAKDSEANNDLSRRSLLFSAGASIAAAPLQRVFAEGVETSGTVLDEQRGFSFAPPQGWGRGTAKFPGADRNPARPEIISYVSPENKDVNLAVVSYSIQPDYTKLGSLGTIDDVAKTILGTSGNLDAVMFSQKEKGVGGGPAYFFEYRIRDKHLLTVFTTQSGQFAGTYLVTLTMQAPLDLWAANEETLQKVAKSFVLEKR
eukprot:CAMPEP_0181300706 /NCGR_PEP_ID=MMETSP1101-20121128/7033_1 /TAXON_ID=46948 /ORGANISM="Rhodomonas abbreviata, Strain Caron Lab Isolate" /LENGTH=256 /DNA_ID=CAMNT_0023405961 /DNA_START=7 /DNA_END=777 /DNA_ORIENTATION=-